MTEKTPPNVRVFSVKTRFQELAQRPGGVPRSVAIQQAENQIDDFKAEFVDWVDRELQELVQTFRGVKNTQPDTAQIEEIDRRCRQLRDTGTTMGLALVTFIADNLCQVLDAIRNGAPCDAEVIDCHIDALFLAKQDAYRNIRPEQVPEMTKGLHRMLERANRKLPADNAG
jgi:chemotaxis protein histidine kinase CheA